MAKIFTAGGGTSLLRIAPPKLLFDTQKGARGEIIPMDTEQCFTRTCVVSDPAPRTASVAETTTRQSTTLYKYASAVRTEGGRRWRAHKEDQVDEMKTGMSDCTLVCLQYGRSVSALEGHTALR